MLLKGEITNTLAVGLEAGSFDKKRNTG